MPASAFYSKESGGATTCGSQSVISTCYSTFEAFVGDNFLFYDINECFNWLKEVEIQIDLTPDTESWFHPHNKYDVFNKLKGMFLDWKDSYEKPLWGYVSNLSQNKLNRIYYKNKLHEFTIDHPEIANLHRIIMDRIKLYPLLSNKIVKKKDPNWEMWETMIPKEFIGKFDNPGEYNKFVSKEMFMDPNDVPDSIKNELKVLKDYYMKYVYTPYLVFDKIYRLKNFTRKAVVIVDTDSNILALDQYMNFICSDIITNCDKPLENREFIIINTIAYVLTAVVTDVLLFYGERANIPEEFRPKFNMKNEFYMKKLIISDVKKRYMSLFKLREGLLLDPPLTDIKGFDFMKSSTSDVCSDLFKKLSEDYLLKAEKIDIKGLREELRKLEKDVMEDMECGNLTYLPIANAKELEAYAEPGSEQSVRGVIAWNCINPDDHIDLPSKVRMLKLTLFTENDLEPMKRSYPDIYDKIMTYIFNDTSGIFVNYKMKNGKRVKNVKGLEVLAIPERSSIPDWAKPYIDYNTMVGSITSPFKSVTDLLKMVCVSTGYTKNGVKRSSESFTNIISF